MLRIAVCDDEKIYRNHLKKLIATELDLCGLEYQFTEFSCGEDLLQSPAVAGLHILFLDIELPGQDGIAIAKKLREKKYEGEIIFITSHPDFVFQGYEVRALHYILKPCEKNKILSVLHTALEMQSRHHEKYYLIKRQGASIRLPLTSVKYFHSDKRMVRAVTLETEYVFYAKLSDLEKELPESFIRIHSRYLVNLQHIEELRGKEALIDGEVLPVSRSCQSKLSIHFAKYMLDEENPSCQS